MTSLAPQGIEQFEASGRIFRRQGGRRQNKGQSGNCNRFNGLHKRHLFQSPF
jgi:hypothetical protein